MNQIKGSGCEHMKFLTFGTSLHKMKHPTRDIQKLDFEKVLPLILKRSKIQNTVFETERDQTC